ncbi:hypothetical protein Micbo1qcDRAFT_27659 [Microdochium bolleyi]|uniref:Uncharacterized protein n=1 Tax=Microdochium bolleyi TaxID=196109 RepID=A0A136JEQ8_9PEZI|nr:hypothetical protein Micbo1qcDRAFT_27659 [Microdochium bolleyi]
MRNPFALVLSRQDGPLGRDELGREHLQVRDHASLTSNAEDSGQSVVNGSSLFIVFGAIFGFLFSSLEIPI